MPSPRQYWPLDLKVVSSCLHTLAIGSGIFRSTYRWYISRFGWEDTWALLALLTDVGCFVCSWLEQSLPPNPSNTTIILIWINVVTLTSVPWVARLSMIATIIRITNPHARTRRVSYAIAIAFGSMWIAILAQKLYNCATQLSPMSHGVAISQLITDVISDTLLVVTPVFFLKGMKISRDQHVLLVSSFAFSICITIVSVAHSIILFLPVSSTSVLMAHIKAALSVIICNLLVILTFVYRFFRKTDKDLGGVPIESEPVQFTTVALWQPSLGSCSCLPSLPSPCSRCIPSLNVHNVSSTPTGLVHDSNVN